MRTYTYLNIRIWLIRSLLTQNRRYLEVSILCKSSMRIKISLYICKNITYYMYIIT